VDNLILKPARKNPIYGVSLSPWAIFDYC